MTIDRGMDHSCIFRAAGPAPALCMVQKGGNGLPGEWVKWMRSDWMLRVPQTWHGKWQGKGNRNLQTSWYALQLAPSIERKGRRRLYAINPELLRTTPTPSSTTRPPHCTPPHLAHLGLSMTQFPAPCLDMALSYIRGLLSLLTWKQCSNTDHIRLFVTSVNTSGEAMPTLASVPHQPWQHCTDNNWH